VCARKATQAHGARCLRCAEVKTKCSIVSEAPKKAVPPKAPAGKAATTRSKAPASQPREAPVESDEDEIQIVPVPPKRTAKVPVKTPVVYVRRRANAVSFLF
jgi:hypothetical protein